MLALVALAGAGFTSARPFAQLFPLAQPITRRHCTAADASPVGGRILRVGPDRDFFSPSAAAAVARDGDVVEFEPGTYAADAAVWRAHCLTLRAREGTVHLRADGAHAEGKAIWVVKGNDTLIEGVAFSGCRVPHGNGAGIRQEGTGLVLRHCLFSDNENGILTGANPSSDILVEHCEFGRNGRGDGYTHNIYVGAVRSLTIRYSHLHRALGGHCLKSRALRTLVICNRIADEATGQSSYEVEFPNGGLAVLMGNLIQQGPRTRNRTLVSYGVEGLTHPLNELHAAHNTLVNDHAAGGRFFFVAPGTAIARLVNNVFVGKGVIVSDEAEQNGNRNLSLGHFNAPAAGDYRPIAEEHALRAPQTAGYAHGISLTPGCEYVHARSHRRRADLARISIGAHAAMPAAENSTGR